MTATIVTPKLGLVLPTAGNPDYRPSNAIGLLTAAIVALEAGPDALQTLTSAGEIAVKPGRVLLKAGKDAAFTLALPKPPPTKATKPAVLAKPVEPAKPIASGNAAAAATPAVPAKEVVPVAAEPVKDGGDDGLAITIVAFDAFAYTVTTPVDGIDGKASVATFTVHPGSHINLIAKDGIWETVGAPLGVSLS